MILPQCVDPLSSCWEWLTSKALLFLTVLLAKMCLHVSPSVCAWHGSSSLQDHARDFQSSCTHSASTVICSVLTDEENRNVSGNRAGTFPCRRNETEPSPHAIHTTPGSSRTQTPNSEKWKSDVNIFLTWVEKTPKIRTVN